MGRVHVVVVALVVVASGVAMARSEEATRPVAVQLFQFQPGVVDVPAGTTVTWRNQDDIEHTVTAGEPERRTGRFDQRLDGRGATATLRFGEPGVYRYFCDRHPSMRGEIRVR